jgi:hypothetical protein
MILTALVYGSLGIVAMGQGVQPRMPSQQTTHGPCSPIVTGDNNTLTITCADKRLLDFIRTMVTRIADKQLDPEFVYSKFDEVLKGISQLRDSVAPRSFSEQQKAAMVKVLAPFKGKPVRISCILGDAESFRYAEYFVAVMRAAGLDVGPFSGIDQAVFTGVPEGVFVRVKDDAHLQSPLIQAFGQLWSLLEFAL